jgi:hypothetical protein
MPSVFVYSLISVFSVFSVVLDADLQQSISRMTSRDHQISIAGMTSQI